MLSPLSGLKIFEMCLIMQTNYDSNLRTHPNENLTPHRLLVISLVNTSDLWSVQKIPNRASSDK
jgi:hypothetical protein